MIKNVNKTEIYENYINFTPLILPCKHQIKLIHNEPKQDRTLREKIAMEEMKAAIELLKLR